jgi:hypothetical protein
MRSPCALKSCLSALLGLFSVSACNLANVGDPPPDADIYFPTGMFLSGQSEDSAPRFLYVVNSNFDLRYNRGSVQAFDLDALEAKISGCAQPGLDCQIAAPEVIVDEVLVPSLATAYSVTPDRKRLYLTTRTDHSLLFIDLDETGDGEDVLQCDESERRCSDDRRRGVDPSENARGATFPAEPVSIVTLAAASAVPGLDPASVPGNFVMVAHRWGQVSLFHDNGASGPRLIHVLDQLPLEPTGIDFDPIGHLAYLSLGTSAAHPVPNGTSRLISRVAFSVEVGDNGSLDASYLYDVGAVIIDGVAPQRSTRTLRMNPARPGELLITGERPASLMFVDVGNDKAASLAAPTLPAHEIVTVGDGPMRMTYGKVGTRDVIAVSCFDAKQLYLVDPVSYTVLGVLHNLNGPFDVAIDELRKRLYISDFRSSSVLVVDLSAVAEGGSGDRTDAPIVAMLGIPKVVMELQ